MCTEVDEIWEKNLESVKEAALLIGLRTMDRKSDVEEFLSQFSPSPPFLYIKVEPFEESGEVEKLTSNMLALLGRLKENNNLKKVKLFFALPKNVVPLVMAYFPDNIEYEFFDYSRKENTYIQLPILTP